MLEFQRNWPHMTSHPEGRFGGLGGGGSMGTDWASLANAMDNADYVLVDGVVFATEYLRNGGDIERLRRVGGSAGRDIRDSETTTCAGIARFPGFA